MCKRMIWQILSALAVTLVFACLGSAHELVVSDHSKLGNGPMLEPGTYKIEVAKDQSAPEVLFYQGRDLVLRTPVTLTPETNKPTQTEIHSENREEGRVITRIRVKGWTESIVFN